MSDQDTRRYTEAIRLVREREAELAFSAKALSKADARIAELTAQLAAAVEGLEKISNIKVDYTWPEEMVRLRNEICTDTLAKVKALGETEKVENKDGEG